MYYSVEKGGGFRYTCIDMENNRDTYTVLVVEDEANMARLIEFQLKAQGYQVLKASNGQEALAMAWQTKPDLVLSDIMMPLMDGYELCRHMKKHPDLWHIPVILLSAKADLASMIHGYAVGAAKYLIKPMKKEELFKAVDLRLKYAAKARQMLERKAKDFEGDLARISIFKILDMFFIGGWSGHVELEHPSGQKGSIYIKEGGIERCSLEGQFSPYSIFLLLSWAEGKFWAHRY